MLRRIKEEDEFHKKIEQRIAQEKEKIREEWDKGVRPSNLTDEEKKIRSIIRHRAEYARNMMARAATDGKYRQSLEAKKQRGKEPIRQRAKCNLPRLTEQERKCRNALLARRTSLKMRQAMKLKQRTTPTETRQDRSKNTATVEEAAEHEKEISEEQGLHSSADLPAPAHSPLTNFQGQSSHSQLPTPEVPLLEPGSSKPSRLASMDIGFMLHEQ